MTIGKLEVTLWDGSKIYVDSWADMAEDKTPMDYSAPMVFMNNKAKDLLLEIGAKKEPKSRESAVKEKSPDNTNFTGKLIEQMKAAGVEVRKRPSPNAQAYEPKEKSTEAAKRWQDFANANRQKEASGVEILRRPNPNAKTYTPIKK